MDYRVYHKHKVWRRLLGAAALLAAIVTGIGCGEEAGAGKVQIRFWNGFTGPDGRTMMRLVKRFNDENPDVQVTMQRTTWVTYYNKLFVAGRGRRAPEVFVITTEILGRFIDAGQLHNMDGAIAAEADFPADDFDAIPWKGAQRNGSQYAIPLDIHPMGMFYNKQLLKDAGIVDAEGEAKPPETREEFMATLRALRALGSTRGSGEVWGAVLPNFRTFAISLMRQNGGAFFNADNSRCLLNSPQNIEALQWIVDASLKERLIAPLDEYSYFDAWVNFRNGQSGIAFEGIFMLGDLKMTQKLPYAGAPTPQIFDRRVTYAASHNLCMPAGIEGEKEEAAWRFIMFLSEHSLAWADAGQLPARRSFRETEAFKAYELQHEFAKQIPYMFYAPMVPYILEFWTEFDIAVESAMRGSVSPADALAQAERRINAVIARQRGQDR